MIFVLKQLFFVFLIILINYTIECDNNPWKNVNNQSPAPQPGGDWPAIGEKRNSGIKPDTPDPQNVCQNDNNNKGVNNNDNKCPANSQNSRRDYVNPNIPPNNQQKNANNNPGGNNNNPNGNNNAPGVQNSRRDYVNPNIPPNNQQKNGNNNPGGNNNNSNGNNNAPGVQNSRRDYVNPNIPPNNQPKNNNNNPGGSNNKPNGNNNAPGVQNPQNSRRDYVNPNIPSNNQQNNNNNNPGGNNNKPSGNYNAPATQNTRRDYVNPNIKPNQNIVANNPGGNNQKPVQSYSGAAKQNLPNQPSPQSIPQLVPQSVPQSPGNTPESRMSQEDKTKEDNELREFSEALIKKDINNAAKYVKINYQGKTNSYSKDDLAPEPLLQISDDAYKIPSISKFMLLHNNYILDSTTNEVYTAAEKIEENNFIDTIISTPVMEATRNFLVKKGKISKDPKDFKALLKTIWFNMYSRGGGRIGSSGFEHVFVAEFKKNEVSGLHNWLYFNAEEAKRNANYLGYMKKLEFDKGAIVKYHFTFHDVDKPVGGMFIGTSPEFEMALYSTCFILRPDQICPMRLGGKNFGIRTYVYRYRGKEMVGSAFPDI